MPRTNFAFLLILAAAGPRLASAQSGLNCTANAVPALVRMEGLAERLGDIVLNCSVSPTYGSIAFNLTVFLNVNITNKLSAANTVDAQLLIDTGSGPVATGIGPNLTGQNVIVFPNVSVPANGNVSLRISNLRGAATQADRPGAIVALLAANGPSPILVNNSPLTIGFPQRGLLATHASTFFCGASPLPAALSFMNLLGQGTRFVSSRITEGFGDAFQKGTRVVVRYAGFPAGSKLYVADAIAGSSAAQPTAAGDLGGLPSPGSYGTTAAGSLLLVRVANPDANGAGGTLLNPAVNSVSEVPLTAGAGQAVFEVADANPSAVESAQITSFLGLDTRPDTTQASVAVSFGPVSAVAVADATSATPRFLALNPPSDCTALRDCDAPYFPKLLVDAPQPLTFDAFAGSAFQIRYIRIVNTNGGLLNWNAVLTYKSGMNWLRLDQTYGVRNSTIRLDALPEVLTPGTYEASLLIDAGPVAGSRTLPVSIRVTQLALPSPQVRSAVNAADNTTPALVAGSIGTLYGSAFAGSKVDLTIDGAAAPILFSNDTQINFLIPVALGIRKSAAAVVTVDGRASAPRAVDLVESAPAIFPGAALNQNYERNSAQQPASTGSIMQVFLTGLGVREASVKVHDRVLTQPYYAGPAPGIPGVQQVDFAIPEDLPSITTTFVICGGGACTAAAPVSIRNPGN